MDTNDDTQPICHLTLKKGDIFEYSINNVDGWVGPKTFDRREKCVRGTLIVATDGTKYLTNIFKFRRVISKSPCKFAIIDGSNLKPGEMFQHRSTHTEISPWEGPYTVKRVGDDFVHTVEEVDSISIEYNDFRHYNPPEKKIITIKASDLKRGDFFDYRLTESFEWEGPFSYITTDSISIYYKTPNSKEAGSVMIKDTEFRMSKEEILYDKGPVEKLPDSGERTQFFTGAVRDAATGKGCPSMVPPECLRRVWRHYEKGSIKYGDSTGDLNYKKGISLSRMLEGIMRHANSAAEGDESEDHLAAVVWNAFTWMWTQTEIEAGRLPMALFDLPFHKRFVPQWEINPEYKLMGVVTMVPPGNKTGKRCNQTISGVSGTFQCINLMGHTGKCQNGTFKWVPAAPPAPPKTPEEMHQGLRRG